MNKNNNPENNEISTQTDSKVKNGKFEVGQEIEATITGFKEYGAFCNCGQDYTGLIHISRITSKYVRNVSDYFTIGQKIKAKIIEIPKDSKKLSLSTREYNIEPKNDVKTGFNGLVNKLDSWFKEDNQKK